MARTSSNASTSGSNVSAVNSLAGQLANQSLNTGAATVHQKTGLPNPPTVPKDNLSHSMSALTSLQSIKDIDVTDEEPSHPLPPIPSTPSTPAQGSPTLTAQLSSSTSQLNNLSAANSPLSASSSRLIVRKLPGPIRPISRLSPEEATASSPSFSINQILRSRSQTALDLEMPGSPSHEKQPKSPLHQHHQVNSFPVLHESLKDPSVNQAPTRASTPNIQTNNPKSMFYLDESYLIPQTVAQTTRQRGRPASDEDIDRLPYTVHVYLQLDGKDRHLIRQKMMDLNPNQSIPRLIAEMKTSIRLHFDVTFVPALLHSNKVHLKEGTLSSNNIQPQALLELTCIQDSVCEPMDIDFVQKIEPQKIYLSFMLVDPTKQLLMTSDGLLPTFALTDCEQDTEEFTEKHKDFLWMCSKSLDWCQSPLLAIKEGMNPEALFTSEGLQKQLNLLSAAIVKGKNSAAEIKSLRFREKCVKACLKAVLGKLKLSTFGTMYYEIIRSNSVDGAVFLLSMHSISNLSETELFRSGLFKIKPAKSLHTCYLKSNDEIVWKHMNSIIQHQQTRLAPGVYVGVFRCQTTMDSVDILAVRHDLHTVPITRLRAESQFLNDEEIMYLRLLVAQEQGKNNEKINIMKPKENLIQLAELFKQTTFSLSQQVGVPLTVGSLTFNSPIVLRQDVMLLLLTTNSDTEIQKSSSTALSQPVAKVQKSFLQKLSSISDLLSESLGTSSTVQHFKWIPMALFEMLHHNMYNHKPFAAYRNSLELLQLTRAAETDSARIADLDRAIGEARKKWTSEQSWTMQILHKSRQTNFNLK